MAGMLIPVGGLGGEKEGESGKKGSLVNGILGLFPGSGGDSNPVEGEGAGDGGSGKNEGSCKTLFAIWILDLTLFLPEVARSNLPEAFASEEPTNTSSSSSSSSRVANLSWGLGFIDLQCQRPATSMLSKD